MPARYRTLLGLPQMSLSIMKPTVAAMLGGMQVILGPQSPSLRNAHQRMSTL
jgi:hypothetical protein